MLKATVREFVFRANAPPRASIRRAFALLRIHGVEAGLPKVARVAMDLARDAG